MLLPPGVAKVLTMPWEKQWPLLQLLASTIEVSPVNLAVPENRFVRLETLFTVQQYPLLRIRFRTAVACMLAKETVLLWAPLPSLAVV